MMNYEIFKDVVEEKFMDYMPDEFKNAKLAIAPVQKVNVTLDGLSILDTGATDVGYHQQRRKQWSRINAV